MIDHLLTAKIKATLTEAKTHLERLQSAKAALSAHLPLTQEPKQELLIARVDQYLYRFAKLQDVLGARLFPQTLELVDELPRGTPFIDILNQLEQLNALPSASQWQQLRELRNSLSHEYADEANKHLQEINLAFSPSAKKDLCQIQIIRFLHGRQDLSRC